MKTTNKTKIPVKYQKKITEMYENRVRKVPVKTLEEVLKARGEFIDDYKQAMADKLQQNRNHTNFAEEIYQSQKTDKFLDRAFYITCATITVLAITLIIVNIK